MVGLYPTNFKENIMKLMFKDTNNTLRVLNTDSLEAMLDMVYDYKANKEANKKYIKDATGIDIKGALLGVVK